MVKKRLIIDWEKKLLKMLEVAYKNVMGTGGSNRWIMAGWLCTTVGLWVYDTKGRLHWFSALREFY